MHSGTRSHDGDRVESLHSAMGTLASRSGSGPEDPQPGPAPAGPASRPAPPRPTPRLWAPSADPASPGHVTPEQLLFNHCPHLRVPPEWRFP